jgi:UDP-N-acetylmuramyl pentapeptide synthase
LHNASNCCAAAAIAHAAGIDFATIVAGLEQFRASSKRMERLTSPRGLRILNDSYNANPASMASGLRTLGSLPARTRMAILGDMLELGEASRDLHRSIGNVAAQSDLSYLVLVGEFAEQIKQGAQTSGMDPDRIRVFEDKNEIIDWIGELLGDSHLLPGDWLLVKASRGLALDTVVDQIMERC